MITKLIRIDQDKFSTGDLKDAAKALADGKLVAFPTETVYGLGANAFNEDAVKNIFRVKGRPQDNPLIVHIAEMDRLLELVMQVGPSAQKLIDIFWPGPLTLVFRKKNKILSMVTSGLDTIAIRMPSHAVALSLIRQSNVPVVAPSANISGKPSPTQAGHVIQDLNGQIPYIFDCGPTEIGLESTVVDVSSEVPVLLRPGAIPAESIEKVIGQVKFSGNSGKNQFHQVRSPGMKYNHYSPKARVELIFGKNREEIRTNFAFRMKELKTAGKRTGVILHDNISLSIEADVRKSAGEPTDLALYAANLFHYFRQMDQENVDVILAQATGEKGLGLAIMNRLRKAAGII